MTLRLAIFSIGSIVVYLGLAILGWGGFGPFFAHPARVAAAVLIVVLAVVAMFTRANISPGEREDRANRWVLAAFAVLGLASAYVPAYTDRLDLWTIDGDAIRWLGVALFGIGGALRLWPVFVLGRRFSALVAIQRGHTLVTTGVYRFIRNPSYLGLLVGAFGWALVFRSLAGVLLAALNLVPLIVRIRAEEALLRAHFSAEYDAYCRRTSRLIPGVY